jgi:hypothetical protein
MLAEASPEKLAAVERFLAGQAVPETKGSPPPEGDPASRKLRASVEGDPSSGNFWIRVAPANEASQGAMPEPVESTKETLSLAAKVFELLTALDPGKRIRKAPPITVFLLRYRRHLSRSEIARVCGCDKSLVAVRLRAIQEKVPWQPRQLQELSAHVEAMQEALSDPRARRIYRRGAVYGSQEDDEGSD